MNNNSFETSSTCGKSEDSQFSFLLLFKQFISAPPPASIQQGKSPLNQIVKYLRSHQHPVEKINKAVRGADAVDIATNINGKVLHIQFLPANVAQSPGQWRYQRQVEQCGDVYRLVRSFFDFHEVFSVLTRRQNIDYTKPVQNENEAVAIMTNCVTLADLKVFYLSNSTLIDATPRATNCYKARRALIPFKNRHHG